MEITLVYAELTTSENDRVDMPDKKVQVYIFIGYKIMSRIGKPLGCLIFFWDKEGPERRIEV